ncbi:Uncharacterised protein [Mycobacteroides abscessus subsp. abscessus]|nr:Uncharacterised protein [Mycobacteroides abscessus subsp. abscessus]
MQRKLCQCFGGIFNKNEFPFQISFAEKACLVLGHGLPKRIVKQGIACVRAIEVREMGDDVAGP